MSEFNIDELLKHINELEAELKSAKKYGLVWDKEKEPELVVERCKEDIPVLHHNKEKMIFKNNNYDNHVLIKGDNFHSLLALNYVLKNNVDLIYIDPPYNTLSDGFLYNDKQVNADDRYRHSKWLNIMQQRLRLARELLSENGYIFISIDEHELGQLKLLCDQIFDEKNCIGVLTWESSTQPTNAGNAKYGLQNKTEFILFYSKKTSAPRIFNLDKIEKSLSYPDFDDNGRPCRLDIIEKSSSGSYNRETMKFEILGHGPRPGKRWQIGEETARELERNGRVVYRDGMVKKIVYPEDESGESFVPFWNHFAAKEYGTAQTGKKHLNDVLGYPSGFDTVKPVALIKKLIFHATHENALILDFFAGSGTTGEAVIELNRENENSHRKFIMCTNNENNIFDNILYPRIKTIITGKRNDGSKYSDGENVNLYTFETDFIKNEKNVEQAKYSLVEKVDSLLCINEDIFNEVERNDCSSHYSNGERHLFIYNDYYSEKKFAEFKQKIEKTIGNKVVYVFSSDNEIDPNLISGIDMQVKPIPSKIYEIYKEIAESIKRGE